MTGILKSGLMVVTFELAVTLIVGQAVGARPAQHPFL